MPCPLDLPVPSAVVGECSCHNHGTDGNCSGIIRLDTCKDCGHPLPPRVILGCGCVQCEPCAVNSLLAKPWASSKTASELLSYFGETDPDQQRRLHDLIISSGIAGGDSVDQPTGPDGSENSERDIVLDQLRNLWASPFGMFPCIATTMHPLSDWT